jgi:hypothetical protein
MLGTKFQFTLNVALDSEVMILHLGNPKIKAQIEILKPFFKNKF